MNLIMTEKNFNLTTIVLFILLFYSAVFCPRVMAESKTCGSFYLRTNSGEIINPLTGKNGDRPFSTRQTCGACHDYNEITKGFHFQQGWDRISDTYNDGKPWELSDGMLGKH